MEKVDSRGWLQPAAAGKLNHQTHILFYVSKGCLSSARVLIFNRSIATKTAQYLFLVRSPLLRKCENPQSIYLEKVLTDWLTSTEPNNVRV